MLYAAFKMMILPPGIFVVMGGLGWLLWNRHPRIARWLIGSTVALLYLLSTRLVSVPLADFVAYDYTPLTYEESADAIVVLAGGHRQYAPEYGGSDVNRHTLERIRYAARLQKETALPILTSGGPSRPSWDPHAILMQRALTDEFGADVPWAETTSKTTWQNAEKSASILLPAGKQRIYLVTHALHMHRSVMAFEAAGFEVIPAPTIFYEPVDLRTYPLAIVPSVKFLEQSRHALYELYGWLKYVFAKV